MALKIERYDANWDEGEMVPCSDGEWVSYEDHEDMLYLAERHQVQEPEKAPDWLVQARAEAAEARVREVEANVEHWRAAWHEGDALRTKLQARLDEMEGWLQQCRERKGRLADELTEMAEARRKLDSGGWVRDAMTRACPGWQRQFAAHAGDRWTEGDTTADEQLAWVLNRLVDRVKAQDKKTGFEEG